jgi:hypothetical protein
VTPKHDLRRDFSPLRRSPSGSECRSSKETPPGVSFFSAGPRCTKSSRTGLRPAIVA